MMGSYQYEQSRPGKRNTLRQSSLTSDITDEKIKKILPLTPTPENAKVLSQYIKRNIFETRDHVRRTPKFILRVHDNIMLIHDYNCRLEEIRNRYFLDESFKELMLIYIKLELGVLKNQEYNNNSYYFNLEQRILTLLRTVFSRCSSNPQEIWTMILNFLTEIPFDVHDYFNQIIEHVKEKIYQCSSMFSPLEKMKRPSQLTCYSKEPNSESQSSFPSYLKYSEPNTKDIGDDIIILDENDTGQRVSDAKLKGKYPLKPERWRKKICSDKVCVGNEVKDTGQGSSRFQNGMLHRSALSKGLNKFQCANNSELGHLNNGRINSRIHPFECDDNDVVIISDESRMVPNDIIDLSEDLSDSSETEQTDTVNNCLTTDNKNQSDNVPACVNVNTVNNFSDSRCKSANVISDTDRTDLVQSSAPFTSDVTVPGISKQIEHWITSNVGQITIQEEQDRVVIHLLKHSDLSSNGHETSTKTTDTNKSADPTSINSYLDDYLRSKQLIRRAQENLEISKGMPETSNNDLRHPQSETVIDLNNEQNNDGINDKSTHLNDSAYRSMCTDNKGISTILNHNKNKNLLRVRRDLQQHPKSILVEELNKNVPNNSALLSNAAKQPMKYLQQNEFYRINESRLPEKSNMLSNIDKPIDANVGDAISETIKPSTNTNCANKHQMHQNRDYSSLQDMPSRVVKEPAKYQIDIHTNSHCTSSEVQTNFRAHYEGRSNNTELTGEICTSTSRPETSCSDISDKIFKIGSQHVNEVNQNQQQENQNKFQETSNSSVALTELGTMSTLENIVINNDMQKEIPESSLSNTIRNMKNFDINGICSIVTNTTRQDDNKHLKDKQSITNVISLDNPLTTEKANDISNHCTIYQAEQSNHYELNVNVKDKIQLSSQNIESNALGMASSVTLDKKDQVKLVEQAPCTAKSALYENTTLTLINENKLEIPKSNLPAVAERDYEFFEKQSVTIQGVDHAANGMERECEASSDHKNSKTSESPKEDITISNMNQETDAVVATILPAVPQINYLPLQTQSVIAQDLDHKNSRTSESAKEDINISNMNQEVDDVVATILLAVSQIDDLPLQTQSVIAEDFDHKNSRTSESAKEDINISNMNHEVDDVAATILPAVPQINDLPLQTQSVIAQDLNHKNTITSESAKEDINISNINQKVDDVVATILPAVAEIDVLPLQTQSVIDQDLDHATNATQKNHFESVKENIHASKEKQGLDEEHSNRNLPAVVQTDNIFPPSQSIKLQDINRTTYIATENDQTCFLKEDIASDKTQELNDVQLTRNVLLNIITHKGEIDVIGKCEVSSNQNPAKVDSNASKRNEILQKVEHIEEQSNLLTIQAENQSKTTKDLNMEAECEPSIKQGVQIIVEDEQTVTSEQISNLQAIDQPDEKSVQDHSVIAQDLDYVPPVIDIQLPQKGHIDMQGACEESDEQNSKISQENENITFTESNIESKVEQNIESKIQEINELKQNRNLPTVLQINKEAAVTQDTNHVLTVQYAPINKEKHEAIGIQDDVVTTEYEQNITSESTKECIGVSKKNQELDNVDNTEQQIDLLTVIQADEKCCKNYVALTEDLDLDPSGIMESHKEFIDMKRICEAPIEQNPEMDPEFEQHITSHIVKENIDDCDKNQELDAVEQETELSAVIQTQKYIHTQSPVTQDFDSASSVMESQDQINTTEKCEEPNDPNPNFGDEQNIASESIKEIIDDNDQDLKLDDMMRMTSPFTQIDQFTPEQDLVHVTSRVTAQKDHVDMISDPMNSNFHPECINASNKTQEVDGVEQSNIEIQNNINTISDVIDDVSTIRRDKSIKEGILEMDAQESDMLTSLYHNKNETKKFEEQTSTNENVSSAELQEHLVTNSQDFGTNYPRDGVVSETSNENNYSNNHNEIIQAVLMEIIENVFSNKDKISTDGTSIVADFSKILDQNETSPEYEVNLSSECIEEHIDYNSLNSANYQEECTPSILIQKLQVSPTQHINSIEKQQLVLQEEHIPNQGMEMDERSGIIEKPEENITLECSKKSSSTEQKRKNISKEAAGNTSASPKSKNLHNSISGISNCDPVILQVRSNEETNFNLLEAEMSTKNNKSSVVEQIENNSEHRSRYPQEFKDLEEIPAENKSDFENTSDDTCKTANGPIFTETDIGISGNEVESTESEVDVESYKSNINKSGNENHQITKSNINRTVDVVLECSPYKKPRELMPDKFHFENPAELVTDIKRKEVKEIANSPLNLAMSKDTVNDYNIKKVLLPPIETQSFNDNSPTKITDGFNSSTISMELSNASHEVSQGRPNHLPVAPLEDVIECDKGICLLANTASCQPKIPVPESSSFLKFSKDYISYKVYQNIENCDQQSSQLYNSEATDGSDSDGKLLIDSGICTISEQFEDIEQNSNTLPPRVINGEVSLPIQDYLEITVNTTPKKKLNSNVSRLKPKTKAQVKQLPPTPPILTSSDSDDNVPLAQRILPRRTPSPRKGRPRQLTPKSNQEHVKIASDLNTDQINSIKKAGRKPKDKSKTCEYRSKLRSRSGSDIIAETALTTALSATNSVESKDEDSSNYLSKLRRRSGSSVEDTHDAQKTSESTQLITIEKAKVSTALKNKTLISKLPNQTSASLDVSPKKKRGRKPKNIVHITENPLEIIKKIEKKKPGRKTTKKNDLLLEVNQTSKLPVCQDISPTKEVIEILNDPSGYSIVLPTTSPRTTLKERYKQALKAQINNPVASPEFNEKSLPLKWRQKFFTRSKNTIIETTEKLQQRLENNGTKVDIKFDVNDVSAEIKGQGQNTITEYFRTNDLKSHIVDAQPKKMEITSIYQDSLTINTESSENVKIDDEIPIGGEVEVHDMKDSKPESKNLISELDVNDLPPYGKSTPYVISEVNFNDPSDSDLVSIAQEAAKSAYEDFDNQSTDFDDSKVDSHQYLENSYKTQSVACNSIPVTDKDVNTEQLINIDEAKVNSAQNSNAVNKTTIEFGKKTTQEIEGKPFNNERAVCLESTLKDDEECSEISIPEVSRILTITSSEQKKGEETGEMCNNIVLQHDVHTTDMSQVASTNSIPEAIIVHGEKSIVQMVISNETPVFLKDYEENNAHKIDDDGSNKVVSSDDTITIKEEVQSSDKRETLKEAKHNISIIKLDTTNDSVNNFVPNKSCSALKQDSFEIEISKLKIVDKYHDNIKDKLVNNQASEKNTITLSENSAKENIEKEINKYTSIISNDRGKKVNETKLIESTHTKKVIYTVNDKTIKLSEKKGCEAKFETKPTKDEIKSKSSNKNDEKKTSNVDNLNINKKKENNIRSNHGSKERKHTNENKKQNKSDNKTLLVDNKKTSEKVNKKERGNKKDVLTSATKKKLPIEKESKREKGMNNSINQELCNSEKNIEARTIKKDKIRRGSQDSIFNQHVNNRNLDISNVDVSIVNNKKNKKSRYEQKNKKNEKQRTDDQEKTIPNECISKINVEAKREVEKDKKRKRGINDRINSNDNSIASEKDSNILNDENTMDESGKEKKSSSFKKIHNSKQSKNISIKNSSIDGDAEEIREHDSKKKRKYDKESKSRDSLKITKKLEDSKLCSKSTELKNNQPALTIINSKALNPMQNEETLNSKSKGISENDKIKQESSLRTRQNEKARLKNVDEQQSRDSEEKLGYQKSGSELDKDKKICEEQEKIKDNKKDNKSKSEDTNLKTKSKSNDTEETDSVGKELEKADKEHTNYCSKEKELKGQISADKLESNKALENAKSEKILEESDKVGNQSNHRKVTHANSDTKTTINELYVKLDRNSCQKLTNTPKELCEPNNQKEALSDQNISKIEGNIKIISLPPVDGKYPPVDTSIKKTDVIGNKRKTEKSVDSVTDVIESTPYPKRKRISNLSKESASTNKDYKHKESTDSINSEKKLLLTSDEVHLEADDVQKSDVLNDENVIIENIHDRQENIFHDLVISNEIILYKENIAEENSNKPFNQEDSSETYSHPCNELVHYFPVDGRRKEQEVVLVDTVVPRKDGHVSDGSKQIKLDNKGQEENGNSNEETAEALIEDKIYDEPTLLKDTIDTGNDNQNHVNKLIKTNEDIEMHTQSKSKDRSLNDLPMQHLDDKSSDDIQLDKETFKTINIEENITCDIVNRNQVTLEPDRKQKINNKRPLLLDCNISDVLLDYKRHKTDVENQIQTEISDIVSSATTNIQISSIKQSGKTCADECVMICVNESEQKKENHESITQSSEESSSTGLYEQGKFLKKVYNMTRHFTIVDGATNNEEKKCIVQSKVQHPDVDGVTNNDKTACIEQFEEGPLASMEMNDPEQRKEINHESIIQSSDENSLTGLYQQGIYLQRENKAVQQLSTVDDITNYEKSSCIEQSEEAPSASGETNDPEQRKELNYESIIQFSEENNMVQHVSVVDGVTNNVKPFCIEQLEEAPLASGEINDSEQRKEMNHESIIQSSEENNMVQHVSVVDGVTNNVKPFCIEQFEEAPLASGEINDSEQRTEMNHESIIQSLEENSMVQHLSIVDGVTNNVKTSCIEQSKEAPLTSNKINDPEQRKEIKHDSIISSSEENNMVQHPDGVDGITNNDKTSCIEQSEKGPLASGGINDPKQIKEINHESIIQSSKENNTVQHLSIVDSVTNNVKTSCIEQSEEAPSVSGKINDPEQRKEMNHESIIQSSEEKCSTHVYEQGIFLQRENMIQHLSIVNGVTNDENTSCIEQSEEGPSTSGEMNDPEQRKGINHESIIPSLEENISTGLYDEGHFSQQCNTAHVGIVDCATNNVNTLCVEQSEKAPSAPGQIKDREPRKEINHESIIQSSEEKNSSVLCEHDGYLIRMEKVEQVPISFESSIQTEEETKPEISKTKDISLLDYRSSDNTITSNSKEEASESSNFLNNDQFDQSQFSFGNVDSVAAYTFHEKSSPNMSPAERVGTCYRNPSPPTNTEEMETDKNYQEKPDDLFLLNIGTDIQKFPILPDFIVNRDDAFLGIEKPDMGVATFFENKTQLFNNTQNDPFGSVIPRESCGNTFCTQPTDNTAIQSSDMIKDTLVSLVESPNKSDENLSSENKTINAALNHPYQIENPHQANLQKLTSTFFPQQLVSDVNPSTVDSSNIIENPLTNQNNVSPKIATENTTKILDIAQVISVESSTKPSNVNSSSNQLTTETELCYDELLDDCKSYIESDNVFAKYVLKKSSENDIETSSNTLAVKGPLGNTSEQNTTRKSTNEISQRNDHTYMMNLLFTSQQESPDISSEFGLNQPESNLLELIATETSGEAFPELELTFNSASSSILGDSNSFPTENDWSFYGTSENPTEILQNLDGHCKVVVKLQPQLPYFNLYSDFSSLEEQPILCGTGISQFPDTRGSNLGKRHIDVDFLEKTASTENSFKKIRLQKPVSNTPPIIEHRKKAIKTQRGKKISLKAKEQIALPQRNWTRRKVPTTKQTAAEHADVGNAHLQNQLPKNSKIVGIITTSNNENLPHLVPLTLGVTTRSSSKNVTKENSWQVTPASQSIYINAVKAKTDICQSKGIETPNSQSPLSGERTSVDKIGVKPDKISFTAASTQPTNLKSVGVTKLDVKGKTVLVKLPKVFTNPNNASKDESTRSTITNSKPGQNLNHPTHSVLKSTSVVKNPTKRTVKLKSVQNSASLISDTRLGKKKLEKILKESKSDFQDLKNPDPPKSTVNMNEIFDNLFLKGVTNRNFKEKTNSEKAAIKTVEETPKDTPQTKIDIKSQSTHAANSRTVSTGSVPSSNSWSYTPLSFCGESSSSSKNITTSNTSSNNDQFLWLENIENETGLDRLVLPQVSTSNSFSK